MGDPKKPGAERPVQYPADCISEALFGLIMAITLMGSMRISSVGHGEMNAMLVGVISCNMA